MTAKTQDNPRRRMRTLKFGIILALASVIMTMWAVVAGSIINSRQSVIESTRHDAADLAGIFGGQVSHTFDNVAAAIGVVASRMRAANNSFDLYSWAHDIPLIDGTSMQAIIVDPAGKLVAASSDAHPQPIDLSNRDEFRRAAADTGDGIIVSHDLVGDQSEFLVTLSRRVTASDGRLLGVAIFFVSPSRLTAMRDSIDIGRDGSVVLAGTDDVVLSGFGSSDPNGALLIGKSLADQAHPSTTAAGAQGYYIESPEGIDINRLHAFYRLDKYPVTVNTSLDLAAALAPERQQTIILVLLAGVGTLVLLGLSVILLREVSHRAAREI